MLLSRLWAVDKDYLLENVANHNWSDTSGMWELYDTEEGEFAPVLDEYPNKAAGSSDKITVSFATGTNVQTYLTENITVDEIYVNYYTDTYASETDEEKLLTIDLKGKTLTVGKCYVGTAGTRKRNTKFKVMDSVGGGTFTVTGYMYFAKGFTHNFTVDTNASVVVTKGMRLAEAYEDADNWPTGDTSVLIKGAGSLTIPYCGAALEYGGSVDYTDIKTNGTLTAIPMESSEVTYYKATISDETVSISGSEMTYSATLGLKRREISADLETINYPYTATVTKAAGSSFSFSVGSTDIDESVTLSDSKYFVKAVGSVMENFTVSGTLQTGDAVSITVYTPDSAFELCTFGIIFPSFVWSGASSTDGTAWSDFDNWENGSDIEEFFTAQSLDFSDLSDFEVTIPASAAYFPVITSDALIKNLVVETGASLSVRGCTLSAESISCDGTIVVDSSSGASVLKTTGSSASSISSLTILGGAASGSNKTKIQGSALSFGTVSVTGACIFNDDFAFTEFNYVPADSDSLISFNGACQFDQFNADSSGLSSEIKISFRDGVKQTFTSVGTVKGNSSSYPLVLTNSEGAGADMWKAYFVAEPDVSNFLYVKINNSKAVSSTGAAVELGLTPSAEKLSEYTGGSTEGWFIFVYKWVGATDNSWLTVSNWTTMSGSAVNNYPPFDSSAAEIVISADSASANELKLSDGITVSAVTTTTLLLKNFTVESGASVNIGSCIISAEEDIENNGKITLWGTQVSAPLVSTGGSITHSAASVIEYKNEGSGTISFFPLYIGTGSGGEKQFKNLIISTAVNSSESFAVTGETLIDAGSDSVTLSGTYTLNGETTISGSNTFGTVVINEDSEISGNNSFESLTLNCDAAQINGDNTFDVLSIIKADSTVTFESGKTQSLGKFLVSGEEDHEIKLKASGSGNWKIVYSGDTSSYAENSYIPDTYISLQFAEIYDSENLTVNSSSEHIYFKVANCIDCGNNFWWWFEGQVYIWKGGVSGAETSWTENDNWSPHSVPGNDTVVVIPDSPAGGAYYPVLQGDINLASLKIGTAAGSSASLTLNGYNITVSGIESDTKFVNYGTVYSFGTETVTFAQAASENGTWSYSKSDLYGQGTLKTVSNLDFKNIEIKGSLYLNGAISAEKITFSTSDVVELSSDCELSAPVVINSDAVVKAAGYTLTFNDSLNDKTEGEHTLTFGSSSLPGAGTVCFVQDISETAVLKEIVFYDKVECTSGCAGINAGEKLSFYSDLNFAAAELTLNASLDGGKINLGGNVTGNNPAGGSLKLSSDSYITGGGTYTLAKLYAEKNLFVSALDSSSEAADVVLNCPVEVEKYFSLYNGNLNFGTGFSLTAGEDIILLNGQAPDMYKDDKDKAGRGYRGGKAGVFKYRGTGPQPSDSVFKSTVNAAGLAGKTLIAKKNFYDNGVDLTASSAWYLKAQDNDNAAGNKFAEIFNAQISYCQYSSSTSADGISYLSAAEADDGGNNNANIAFGHPLISAAFTVYDDVICVNFVDSISGLPVKIENSNNEISAVVAKNDFVCHYNGTGYAKFSGSFFDKECTVSTNGKGDLDCFYLKAQASYKWNTDATGLSAGESESTDRAGTHRTSVPRLRIRRVDANAANYGFKDEHKNMIPTWFDEIASLNISPGHCYTAVTDQCSPVLLAVRTGQELHDSNAASQKTYDSHNFIEFQYSEPVSVNALDETAENVQSDSSFGSMANTSGSTGITVSNLIKTAGGKFSLGSSDGTTPATDLNSIYRKFAASISEGEKEQTHRFRISLAGYVNQDSSVHGSGRNHWLGYINSSESQIPSGSVTQLSYGADTSFNTYIKDLNNNPLVVQSAANHTLSAISVNSAEEDDTVYGSWDLSAPEFAVYKTAIASGDFYEAIGASAATGTVLENIEFHLFDNSLSSGSSAMEGAYWYSQFGWALDSNGSSLYKGYSYAADIFGGSRPFDYSNDTSSASSGRATSGGIRYSSLYDKSSYFMYKTGASDYTDFAASNIAGGGTSSVFFATGSQKRETGAEDSLYFKLQLPSGSNLPLNSEFTIKYDSAACVTDLAGNLLKSAEIKSIDRVAPKFNISFASVSGNKLYVVFNKALNSSVISVNRTDGGTESGTIVDSLRFIKIPGSPHNFSSADVVSDLTILSDPAPVVTYSRSNLFTKVVFTLNRTVTLEDIKNCYLQCYSPYPGVLKDPVTGFSGGNVTFVMDGFSNYMVHGTAHALSDFAVDAVNTKYAYDDRATDDGFNISKEMFKEGSFAVYDWDENQANYGTLVAGHDISLLTELEDGNETSDDEIPENIVVYITNRPDSGSSSGDYNANLDESLRVWLPSSVKNGESATLDIDALPAISSLLNSSFTTYYTSVSEKNARIDFSKESLESAGYGAGNQLSFLFGLADENLEPVKICHAPVYNEVSGSYTLDMQPLFALRLKNKKDPTSVDLWSFRLKSLSLQRGNVTVFNNVIDVNAGEYATLKIDMPSDGKLHIAVMTLDGNIVKYLHHGDLSAGEHNYVWDGRTKAGKKVARGLYFIRVFGNGIDETRKVMVVKN